MKDSKKRKALAEILEFDLEEEKDYGDDIMMMDQEIKEYIIIAQIE